MVMDGCPSPKRTWAENDFFSLRSAGWEKKAIEVLRPIVFNPGTLGRTLIG
jgi:hypothetical protein